MIVTFDTNVLIYTMGSADNTKHERAAGLVGRAARAGTAIFLFQTLAEFSHVATRKLGIDVPTVVRHVDAFREGVPVHVASEEDLFTALEWVRVHHVPFWDALLCATASRAGIPYLLSEDFQDGRRLGAVTIVNPFRPENDGLIDRLLPA